MHSLSSVHVFKFMYKLRSVYLVYTIISKKLWNMILRETSMDATCLKQRYQHQQTKLDYDTGNQTSFFYQVANSWVLNFEQYIHILIFKIVILNLISKGKKIWYFFYNIIKINK